MQISAWFNGFIGIWNSLIVVCTIPFYLWFYYSFLLPKKVNLSCELSWAWVYANVDAWKTQKYIFLLVRNLYLCFQISCSVYTVNVVSNSTKQLFNQLLKETILMYITPYTQSPLLQRVEICNASYGMGLFHWFTLLLKILYINCKGPTSVSCISLGCRFNVNQMFLLEQFNWLVSMYKVGKVLKK